MSFLDPEPIGCHTLSLQMDSAARQGGRSLPALILRLAGNHGLLDVLTFIEPLAEEYRPDGSEAEQTLTIEIRDEEMRLRSFAASLTNLSGIVSATLDRAEILFGSAAKSR